MVVVVDLGVEAALVVVVAAVLPPPHAASATPRTEIDAKAEKRLDVMG